MQRTALPDEDQRDSQLAAAALLAKRVLGPLGDSVYFRGLNADVRSFEHSAQAGTLEIAATDGISACVGLHAYLREACGLSVSWDTPLPLPVKVLPDSGRVRRATRVHDGYYFNFCTFSYTMAYWDWATWEREIDWMALHGVTMPLSAAGHEAAVLLAYQRLGVPEDQILHFLGGPGYLPFQYMGCVDGFAGPLPRSWVTKHAELGRRVMDRQRALGMDPIVPAFAGNVPRSLAPDRVVGRDWMGIESFFLDPSDPLYSQVTAELVHAQHELFGVGHFYAADPFIEMLPVGPDDSYPALVAKATMTGLRNADPYATWVIQAWPFSYQSEYWTPQQVKIFLDSVPDENLLIIDLWAETDPQWSRFDSFGGKPWVWCALLNFGGRTDLIGNLQTAVTQVGQALAAANPPSGVGVSMEGIHNNPAYFELVLDQIWNPVPDLTEWVDRFAEQRYGVRDQPELRRAWRALAQTVYNTGNKVIDAGTWSGVLTAKPSLITPADLREARRRVTDALWYDPAVLAAAWRRMIEVAERNRHLAAGPLGHDLVDVAAAAMARLADRFYFDAAECAHHGDARPAVTRFLAVFTDLDRLLATRPEFTLQAWEDQALSWASDADERALLADNARRIISVWNYTGSPVLDDYAGKIWAGLVGGYYRERWQLWAEGLAVATGSAADAADAALPDRLRRCAERFLQDGAVVAHDALGDVISESRRLYDRYASELSAARLPIISSELRPSSAA